MAILDVLRLSLFTLLSMFHSPGRLIQRRWMTEFVCRLVKRMLSESKGKPIDWLRDRTGVMKIRSSAEKNVTFETVTLAGVACQWCRPKVVPEPRHILVYFHGGGYVIGSVAGYQNTLAQLAESSDAHVLAVDYKSNRLVPSSPDQTPEGLLRQMGAYQASLAKIFPDHTIEVAILWTQTAQLMTLANELTSDALNRVTVS